MWSLFFLPVAAAWQSTLVTYTASPQTYAPHTVTVRPWTETFSDQTITQAATAIKVPGTTVTAPASTVLQPDFNAGVEPIIEKFVSIVAPQTTLDTDRVCCKPDSLGQS